MNTSKSIIPGITLNILAVVLATGLFLNSTAWAAEKVELLYLLDASGSMNASTGGEKRIDAARKALLKSLSELPQGTPVGFRAFAHKVEQKDKEQSCLDSELLAPISAERTGIISRAIETLNPKGYTPLAYSIAQAGKDFDLTHEVRRVIILLSDGEETCGGDPAAELRKLQEQGIKVQFYAIGFAVDAKSREQLVELAKIGKGEYFDAKDGRQLTEALSQASKKGLLVEKTKQMYGTEIRGGDSFETAVPLTNFNQELRLDHHQLPGFYDYFSIQLKQGQEATVLIKTLEKGVIKSGSGKFEPSDSPYGQITINAPDRTSLGSVSASGKFQKNSLSINAESDGTYYILVGPPDSYNPVMAQEGYTFTVSLFTGGDLDSEQDAGDKTSTALPIAVKQYEKNYLGGNDTKDIFKFEAQAGDTVAVGLIPDDESKYYYQVRIIDQYKQQLLAQSSDSAGAGFKSKSIEIKEPGTYFLEVSLNSSGVRSLSPYSLQLFNIPKVNLEPAP